MEFKSKIRKRIYIHRLLTFILLIIFLSNIKDNLLGMSILVVLSLLVIVFNKVDYMTIDDDYNLIVYSWYGIRLYRKERFRINLSFIQSINIDKGFNGKKYGASNPILFDFILGGEFYDADKLLIFDLVSRDERLKLRVNVPKDEILKLINIHSNDIINKFLK